MTLRSYFELHNKCKLLFKEIQVTYFQVSLINFCELIQYKMTFEFWFLTWNYRPQLSGDHDQSE